MSEPVQITIDDLKDWQKVPIGTLIEFWSLTSARIISGALCYRMECAEGWSFSLKGNGESPFSGIKPGTLFVVEEEKP